VGRPAAHLAERQVVANVAAQATGQIYGEMAIPAITEV
jgi:hypothetical protein